MRIRKEIKMADFKLPNATVNLILSSNYYGAAGGDVAEDAFKSLGLTDKINKINLYVPDEFIQMALENQSYIAGGLSTLVLNCTLTSVIPN